MWSRAGTGERVPGIFFVSSLPLVTVPYLIFPRMPSKKKAIYSRFFPLRRNPLFSCFFVFFSVTLSQEEAAQRGSIPTSRIFNNLVRISPGLGMPGWRRQKERLLEPPGVPACFFVMAFTQQVFEPGAPSTKHFRTLLRWDKPPCKNTDRAVQKQRRRVVLHCRFDCFYKNA